MGKPANPQLPQPPPPPTSRASTAAKFIAIMEMSSSRPTSGHYSNKMDPGQTKSTSKK
ncbi:hypothetical protein CHS0354_022941, partial [Potamilus streckersoni]